MNAHDYEGLRGAPGEAPHSGRFSPPVILLARMAGVLAVTFTIVAVIVLHAIGSPRLASGLVTPPRTGLTPPAELNQTPSAEPIWSPTQQSVQVTPAAHRSHPSHPSHPSHQQPSTAPPVRVTIPPVAAPTSGASAEIGGLVTCLSGHSVEGVWVQARVHSAFAKWVPQQVPGKTTGSTSKWWWWLPTGMPYSLRVGCGGTQAAWGLACRTKVVSGMPNNFACIDVRSMAGYGTCYVT
jgi:hypothetical protein